MFSTFNKDKQIVDKYIDNYHIHKNNIYLLRYKLSFQDNPKEFLQDFFKDIEKGSVVFIFGGMCTIFGLQKDRQREDVPKWTKE